MDLSYDDNQWCTELSFHIGTTSCLWIGKNKWLRYS